jgi:hypothetical protein
LLLERSAVPQENPDDTRHFCGKGNDDGIGMGAGKQTAQPLTKPAVATAQGR